MPKDTDDLHIHGLKELTPPSHLIHEFPCSGIVSDLIYQSRNAVHRILYDMDNRLIVIIDSCSIHNTKVMIDYARRLVEQRERFKNELGIVTRAYFEKLRTTVGWRGLINDLHMDGSFKINDGLRTACGPLMNINELDLPAGTEYLDVISPQYITDLVSWGAINARTTESQMHRELTSDLSRPAGFESSIDGNMRIVVDAIKAALQPHRLLSATKGGHSVIVSTTSNEDCHIILRGSKTPNYGAASVQEARGTISKSGPAARLTIDASHANSSKEHEDQIPVCEDVGRQMAADDNRTVGVVVESHISTGRRDHVQDMLVFGLVYNQSATGACIGWDDSVKVLGTLADVVRKRCLVPGSGN